MDTLTDLLHTIDLLPDEDRVIVIDDLERIMELRDGPRELALGLLALDLAPEVSPEVAAAGIGAQRATSETAAC